MNTSENSILQLRRVFGARGSVDRILIKKLGSNPRVKTLFLPEKKVNHIDRYIKKIVLPKKLSQQIRKNITFLKTIRSYRGVRHKAGLPVRGQRTQTNAKTVKKRRSSQQKKLQAKI
jgi:small subunit ribosomal protein S13